MFGLDETFLALRSTLRSVTICSLLIFAHVILVTMAVARKLNPLPPYCIAKLTK